MLDANLRLVLSREIDVGFFRSMGRNQSKESTARNLRAKDWQIRFQNFEDYQFANQLYQCLICWEDLLDANGIETGIVLAFRSVGGCWLDGEVEVGVRTLPAWFLQKPLDAGSIEP